MRVSPSCSTCFIPLVVGDNWSKGSAKAATYKCNICRAEYQRAYHKANREPRLARQKQWYNENKEAVLTQQRKTYIRKTFNISVVEYDEWVSGPCSICKKDTDKVLDHCHTTGKIRGVLCRQCNQAIGLFRESKELIKQAVRYLDENS